MRQSVGKVHLAAIVVLLSISFGSQSALACGPAQLETAVVRSVTAENDVLLVDGRKLRLAGLHMSPGTVEQTVKPGQIAAFGALSDTPDRWSRLPAMVFAADDRQPLRWLQAEALRTGKALARPEQGLGECWALLVKAEADSKLSGGETSKEAGRFTRIEGRVSRVGEGRSAHFVNVFGLSGERITGIVQKRHLKRLADAGVDVKQLRGKYVRLRGVRGVRNLDTIAVILPEQIEIVR